MTPPRSVAIASGTRRRLLAAPGIVEDHFGTAADPRRALATDRRFVSANDDQGHAGRAA